MSVSPRGEPGAGRGDAGAVHVDHALGVQVGDSGAPDNRFTQVAAGRDALVSGGDFLVRELHVHVSDAGGRIAGGLGDDDGALLQWAIDEFPPSAGGIHRSVGAGGTDGAAACPPRRGDWWDLPTYVPRDHDAVLRRRVADAAVEGGFVLVTGRSCAGKTRSAWEAIRSAEYCGWRVVRPRDPDQLRSLFRGTGPWLPAFVWLDEFQRFCSADDQLSLAAEDLRELWMRNEKVVVVGTMWPDDYEDAFVGGSGRAHNDGRTRQMLELAGDPVRVPDRLTGGEVDRAWAAAQTDPQLRLALKDPDHGLTQVLAGVPWLVQRWEQPRSRYTRSILFAAAAVRRIGLRDPVPPGLLRDAAVGYLLDQRPALPGWFDRGLEEASELIRDAVAALVPFRDPEHPERVAGYTLADYLAQLSASASEIEPVPGPVWHALEAHLADAGELLTAARCAERRHLLRHAEALYTKAAACGVVEAKAALVHLLAGQGRIDDALLALEKLRAAGDTTTWPDSLDRPMVTAGRTEELLRLLTEARGPGAAESAIVSELASLKLVAELRRLADRGNASAAWQAAYLLVDEDRLPDAIELLRPHCKNVHAGELLLRLLLTNGQLEDALELIRSPGGSVSAAGVSDMLFQALVDDGRMEDLREIADSPRGSMLAILANDALCGMAVLLEAEGRGDQGLDLLRGTDTDDWLGNILSTRVFLLEKMGRVDEAIDELSRSATFPEKNRRSWLRAQLLHRHNRHQQLQELAIGGDPAAQWTCAKVLAAAGRIDEAARQLRDLAETSACAFDETTALHALDELASLLIPHHRSEEIFEAMRRLAEMPEFGDRRGLLAARLAEQGMVDDLRRAAVSDEVAAAYLPVFLAFHKPAGQLAHDAVSGDHIAARILRFLAIGCELRESRSFIRFGLTPDGYIAMDAEGGKSSIPSAKAIPVSRSSQLALIIAFSSLWKFGKLRRLCALRPQRGLATRANRSPRTAIIADSGATTG